MMNKAATRMMVTCWESVVISTGLIFLRADNFSSRSLNIIMMTKMLMTMMIVNLACCSTAMTKASWTLLFSASSSAENYDHSYCQWLLLLLLLLFSWLYFQSWSWYIYQQESKLTKFVAGAPFHSQADCPRLDALNTEYFSNIFLLCISYFNSGFDMLQLYWLQKNLWLFLHVCLCLCTYRNKSSHFHVWLFPILSINANRLKFHCCRVFIFCHVVLRCVCGWSLLCETSCEAVFHWFPKSRRQPVGIHLNKIASASVQVYSFNSIGMEIIISIKYCNDLKVCLVSGAAVEFNSLVICLDQDDHVTTQVNHRGLGGHWL